MSKYDFLFFLILFGVYVFVLIDKWVTRWIDRTNGW